MTLNEIPVGGVACNCTKLNGMSVTPSMTLDIAIRNFHYFRSVYVLLRG